MTTVTRSHATTQGRNARIDQQGAANAPNHQEWDVDVSVFCYFGLEKMFFFMYYYSLRNVFD